MVNGVLLRVQWKPHSPRETIWLRRWIFDGQCSTFVFRYQGKLLIRRACATVWQMSTDAPQPREVFATTRWSMVQLAGRHDTVRAQQALSDLCSTYWYPLYAYVRRQGFGPEDAQDLTQEFFARFLAGNYLANVSPEKGKFRGFLLACMKHFLSNEWDRARAARRGGGQKPLSIDEQDAEGRYLLEPVTEINAEKLYERRWAMTLLDTVLCRMEAEYERHGKRNVFAALKPTLAGSRESQPYSELARELAISEGAVKVAVHRFRHEYRELLRNEIASTVAHPEDIDAEIRELFSVLSCSGNAL